MKNIKRNGNSGQFLIVTALIIATLIISITLHIQENSYEGNDFDDQLSSTIIEMVKLSSRNAVLSAIANISNGGSKFVLSQNLEKVTKAYLSLRGKTNYCLQHTPKTDGRYADGIWISWGNNGFGISSGCVDFKLISYGLKFNITMDYTVNVTTAIAITGKYFTLINGDHVETNVTVTCRVFNEEGPHLAKQINLYYRGPSGDWVLVNNSHMIDYLNGTYTLSFRVPSELDQVEVSIHILDTRDIFVMASVTCIKI
ncbi:MAG: hypothetical protein QXE94_05690 [Candidatus Bathyarchaeia archaeon]